MSRERNEKFENCCNAVGSMVAGQKWLCNYDRLASSVVAEGLKGSIERLFEGEKDTTRSLVRCMLTSGVDAGTCCQEV